MKKLVLIMLGVVFLSGCSGVKQFTVQEFTQNMQKICNISQTLPSIKQPSENKKSKKSKKSNLISTPIPEIVVAASKIVVATSKTGCSAHVTPISCSLSCGGSDTPQIVPRSQVPSGNKTP